ncbi:MAG: methyl-accepting chemotaxis protein [Armatimonadetes bacterium]|nr:methyl-accepting chemotaxis protein [Armatimonadota bacterium]
MNKLKLGPKLIGGFVVVAIIAAVVGVIGISGISKTGKAGDAMLENEFPLADASMEVQIALLTGRDAAAEYLLQDDPAKLPEIERQFDETVKTFDDFIAGIVKGGTVGDIKIIATDSDEVRKLAEEAGEQHATFERSVKELMRHHQQALAGTSGAAARARASMAVADEVSEQGLADLHKLEEAVGAELASAMEESDASQSSSRTLAVVVSLLGFVSAVVIGVLLSRSISIPMTKMTEAADKLAAGDVNVALEITTTDEIGDLSKSMNTMASTLRALIEEDGGKALEDAANKDLTARVQREYQGAYDKMKNNINSLLEALEHALIEVKNSADMVAQSSQDVTASAEQVGKASQQIAETVGQVAAGSQEQSKTVLAGTEAMEQLSRAIEEVAKGSQTQARTVDETVALIQQITAAIDQVAQAAQTAGETSQQVSEVANTGGQQVARSVDGMGRIKEATDKVGGMVGQLGESSQQIGAIVETIDDIAEQTNLLALNAAIEAARAGEHGKGFAVVADEVRKLAERSSKATGEIADLITNMQHMINQAVEAMSIGSKEVAEGTDLSAQASEALKSIQEAVAGIVGQIQGMAASAQQMSGSSAEVIKAIENVSAITEESTAATEEMAASSTEVTRQIEQVAAVSEENAASAEEVSATTQEQNAAAEELTASSEELATMAENMQQLVAQFKVRADSASNVRDVSAEVTARKQRKAA